GSAAGCVGVRADRTAATAAPGSGSGTGSDRRGGGRHGGSAGVTLRTCRRRRGHRREQRVDGVAVVSGAAVVPAARRSGGRLGGGGRPARHLLAGGSGLPGPGRGHRTGPRADLAAAHRRAAVVGDHRAAVPGLGGAARLRRAARALRRPVRRAAARLQRPGATPPQRCRLRPQRRGSGLRAGLRPRPADRLRRPGRPGHRPAGAAHQHGEHADPAADGPRLPVHRVQRLPAAARPGGGRTPAPARGHEPVRPGHPELPAGQHGLRRHRRDRRRDRAGDHRGAGGGTVGAAGVHHQLRAEHRLRPGRGPAGRAGPARRWVGGVRRRPHRVLVAQLRRADTDPAPVRGRLRRAVDDRHLHRAAVLELGAGRAGRAAGHSADAAGEGPAGGRRPEGALAGRAAARGAAGAPHHACQAPDARPPVGAGVRAAAAPRPPGRARRCTATHRGHAGSRSPRRPLL
ncbi:MAG: hypothetical protein AVDCRST_MAG57-584, partial [uncultured Blastococcus sp.]